MFGGQSDVPLPRSLKGCRAHVLRFLVLALLALLNQGMTCEGCDAEAPGDPPGDGIVRIFIELRSTMPELAGLAITLERVDVVHESFEGGDEGVRTVAEGPLRVGLPGVAFDVATLLLEFPVAPGILHQIRLIGRDGSLTIGTTDGELPLRVPSGEQTGLKIIPEPGEAFIVEPSGLLRILVELDPENELSFNSGTGWRLQPVVRGRSFDELTLSDHLAPDEQLVWAKRTSFIELGVSIDRGVVLDVSTGSVSEVAIDDQGNLVDVAILRDAERAAARAVRGGGIPRGCSGRGGLVSG